MRNGLSPLTSLVTAAALVATATVALAGDAPAPSIEKRIVVKEGNAFFAPAGLATRVEMNVDGNTVQYHRHPVPEHGWLGVLLGPADDGVEVLAVADGSPAARAGLRPGDVITTLDGQDFTEVGPLVGVLKDREGGDRIRIEALRDGRDRTFRVRLGDQPTDVTFEMPEGRELPAGLAPRPPRPSFLPHGPHAAPELNVMRLMSPGKPRLGVQLATMTEQLADYFGVEPGHGVLVQEVVADTPAERAGLEAGDVIVAVGRTEVSSPGDITRALRELGDGDHVTVDVLRRGVARSLEAVLDTPKPEVGEQGAFRVMGGPSHRLAVMKAGDGSPVQEIDVQAIVTDAIGSLDPAELEAAGLSTEEIHELLSGLGEAGDGEARVMVFRGGDGHTQVVSGGEDTVWVSDDDDGAQVYTVNVTATADGSEPHVMVFAGEDGTKQVLEGGEGHHWVSDDSAKEEAHAITVKALADGSEPGMVVFRSADGGEPQVVEMGEDFAWTEAGEDGNVFVHRVGHGADGKDVDVKLLRVTADGAAACHGSALGGAWVL